MKKFILFLLISVFTVAMLRADERVTNVSVTGKTLMVFNSGSNGPSGSAITGSQVIDWFLAISTTPATPGKMITLNVYDSSTVAGSNPANLVWSYAVQESPTATANNGAPMLLGINLYNGMVVEEVGSDSVNAYFGLSQRPNVR